MLISNLARTPILIALIICATVIVLFIIACVHDTIIKSINARSMKKFEKAFQYFPIDNAANNEHLKVNSIAKQNANDLDFTNNPPIETRPQNVGINADLWNKKQLQEKYK